MVHDVQWIFKMSSKYLIVSDVLSGIWKSVISIPAYVSFVIKSLLNVNAMAICVLVWMGQTLNMLLWLHAVVSPRNVNKRQNCFFLSSYCVFFTIFLRMSSQKLCQNYLGTKSTFKAAQKLTSSQFCSKNALNEAIFPKNGSFGKHSIVVSFLSRFLYRAQI